LTGNPSGSVVCNCGPLIALAGIQQLDLLPRLFASVWIPVEVHRELTGSLRFATMHAVFDQSWLQVVSLPGPADALLVAQLDAGEAAVVTLARQRSGAEVLMDERRGRRVAEQIYGLRLVGTGGLLLRAKAAGLIPAVNPLLTAMKTNGYHLSDRLMLAISQAAGE
jgi:predicted nucleic acid-binding protein